MTASELIQALRDVGVALWREGDRLCYSAPHGKLTNALKTELVERKQDVLALLAGPQFGDCYLPPPTMAPLQRHPPLSLAQEALWTLRELQPDDRGRGVCLGFRAQGPLNIEAWRRALREVLHRHDALCTGCATVNGLPRLTLAPPPVSDQELAPLIDLEGMAPTGQCKAIEREVNGAFAEPVDFAQGRLLRSRIVRVHSREHLLLLTSHHFAMDGWSVGLLFRELSALYGAFARNQPSPLPPSAGRYQDYALWQRQRLSSDALEREYAYWLEQLDQAQDLRLPVDHPRAPKLHRRIAAMRFDLPHDVVARLDGLCRNDGATLFMGLLAGFQGGLSLDSGQSDVSVATPVSNRCRQETEEVIGCFANQVLLRTRVDCQAGLSKLLSGVREVVVGAFAHQDLPWELLMEGRTSQGSPPLSPRVKFGMHQYSELESLMLAELELEPLARPHEHSPFELSLVLTATPGLLRGVFEYDTDLLEAETIRILAERYLRLLDLATADPDRSLADLPLPAYRDRDGAQSDSESAVAADLTLVEFAPPQTEMERMLADIWERQLNTGAIGRHDIFFDLGGSSLACAAAVAAIERRFAVRLEFADFIQQSLSQMAATIGSRREVGIKT
ncbi:MAG: condensation domain-containing protein [Planctomycetales bacterium]